MRVLVTGAAGFIGSYVSLRLLERGDELVGLDNINEYYDTNLKYGRLDTLGIGKEDTGWYKFAQSVKYPKFRFIRMNLEDKQAMQMLMVNEGFDVVVNLGAQAGVRYSIQNPYVYVESNVDGFLNILEGCRQNKVKHLVYASSSSVYGLNGKVPFSEKDSIAHPVSLYAFHEEEQRTDGAYLQPPLRRTLYGAAFLHGIWSMGTTRHVALSLCGCYLTRTRHQGVQQRRHAERLHLY